MRLHAQRLPGGLQDAELALEIRATLIDATPWATQVLPQWYPYKHPNFRLCSMLHNVLV